MLSAFKFQNCVIRLKSNILPGLGALLAFSVKMVLTIFKNRMQPQVDFGWCVLLDL